jgi:flavin reductase (DIM6/NTAB) family NADH-FMN oxidoreductase RutF
VSTSPVSLLRCLTTGVYVVGVAQGGHANAFTAAWLTQVSFDPLLLALSINPDNASYPLLQESRIFTVNVLQRGQLDLARHFGCQSARDVDKLAGVRWRAGRLGAPVLLDAAACLECRTTAQMRAGDHEVVIGVVLGGEMLVEDAELLSYRDTNNLDGSAELYPSSFEADRSLTP